MLINKVNIYLFLLSVSFEVGSIFFQEVFIIFTIFTLCKHTSNCVSMKNTSSCSIKHNHDFARRPYGIHVLYISFVIQSFISYR